MTRLEVTFKEMTGGIDLRVVVKETANATSEEKTAATVYARAICKHVEGIPGAEVLKSYKDDLITAPIITREGLKEGGAK